MIAQSKDAGRLRFEAPPMAPEFTVRSQADVVPLVRGAGRSPVVLLLSAKARITPDRGTRT